jgi:hypothetical protein
MVGDGAKQGFGCEHCWPSAADAAWAARGTLAHVQELIDESHLHVMILACTRCSQRFVSVFTETIDWQDGDDPQHWALLPLTPTEAVYLILQGPSLIEAELAALGRGRRCLRHDHPKGAAAQSSWGTGLSVGPHD